MKKRLFVIVAAFSISFVLMVALSLFSMGRFTTFTAYSDQVDHTNSVIKRILRAEIYLRDIDRTERGYMVTRDTMYLRFLNNSIDSIYSVIAEMGRITKDNPQQGNNLTLIKSSMAIRIAAARQNVMYVDTANTSMPSQYYFDSRKLMLECSHRLNDMLGVENKLLKERFEYEQFYQKLTTSTLIYLLVIFCVVTLVLFAIMIKELRSRMLYQQELQAKVIDLKRSHGELKEIAYAASHDLQEPLRKIQVFSNMLQYKKADQMDEDSQLTLKRINNSANRMQLLISDLMSLTSLIKIDEQRKPVDLNKLFQFLLIDADDKIQEKHASIDVQSLPVLHGYEHQLKILFQALVDNALKFSRPGAKPVIVISCEIANGMELLDINPNLQHKKFYRIICSDNGIGFDNQFIAKMFRIFQRLHNEDSEYEGKGIGLAICQRIMANHEGYMIADGKPDQGAQFKMFFPLTS
jgi:signal transduction histidine kinase